MRQRASWQPVEGKEERNKTPHLHLSGDSSRWWSPNTAPAAPPAASDELRGGGGPDAQQQSRRLPVQVLKGHTSAGRASSHQNVNALRLFKGQAAEVPEGDGL